MPEHGLLKDMVTWLQDISVAFAAAKHSLWDISESVVFCVIVLKFFGRLLFRG
jgi:hypothetical protein